MFHVRKIVDYGFLDYILHMLIDGDNLIEAKDECTTP